MSVEFMMLALVVALFTITGLVVRLIAQQIYISGMRDILKDLRR